MTTESSDSREPGAPGTTPKPNAAAPTSDLANVIRGFCMGCADIVPGVSGGTVALITGIYERLVTAISHIDLDLLSRLRQRRWRAAAEHIDLRFLVALAVGIGGGFIVMTLLMNRLLAEPFSRSLTLAAFLGLILGSAIMVAMMIRVRTAGAAAGCLLLGLVAGGVAFWISTLNQLHIEPSLPYVFLCGCVAICAMILPGISGAMILLILGVYIHLTEIPGNLLRGEQVADGLVTIGVFATGAAISLILFSKFLRWVLRNLHAPTMAALCGLMVGALPKLWPFQRDLTPEIEKLKHKQFQPFLPEQFDTQVLLVGLV